MERDELLDDAWSLLCEPTSRLGSVDWRAAVDAWGKRYEESEQPKPCVVEGAEAAALRTPARVAEVCEDAGLIWDSEADGGRGRWSDGTVTVTAVTTSCATLRPDDDRPMFGIFVGLVDDDRREDLSEYASARLLRAAIHDVPLTRHNGAPLSLAVGDTVESAEQLDALPVRTAVRDGLGGLAERFADGWGYTDGSRITPTVPLPARVLDLPGSDS